MESAEGYFVNQVSERLFARAQQHIAAGQTLSAITDLESLLEHEPRMPRARLMLSSMYLATNRTREASAQAIRAAKNIPGNAAAVVFAVKCLLRAVEHEAAHDCLTHYDTTRHQLDVPQLRDFARLHYRLGDHAAALALMDRAVRGGDKHPETRYFRGVLMQFNGQTDAARHELAECLQLEPGHGWATLALARLGKEKPCQSRLSRVRAYLDAGHASREQRAALEFAQFEELDTLGEYDDAFTALVRGNALMHDQLSAKPKITTDIFRGLKRVVTSEPAGAVSDTDRPMPIFVVGLARSGTTILDRMLGNHPDVVSAGELADFPLQLRWCAGCFGNREMDPELLGRLPAIDYAEVGWRYLEQTRWRAGGKRFYVDKLPSNHLLVGLIHKALPRAPILHMTRDASAVCFSNYRAMFGRGYAYSYSMDTLAQYYLNYRALMRHWHQTVPERLLDVSYRQLVTHPERTLLKVFRHCGLTPVPGCSDLTKNTAATATLSSPQVRQPVHTRGLGTWRKFEGHLTPLLSALAAAGSTQSG